MAESCVAASDSGSASHQIQAGRQPEAPVGAKPVRNHPPSREGSEGLLSMPVVSVVGLLAVCVCIASTAWLVRQIEKTRKKATPSGLAEFHEMQVVAPKVPSDELTAREQQNDQRLEWIQTVNALLPAAAPPLLSAGVNKTVPAVLTIVPVGSDKKCLGTGFLAVRKDWLVTSLRVVAGYARCRAIARSAAGEIIDSRFIEGFVAYDEDSDLVVLALNEDWPVDPLVFSSTGSGAVLGATVFAVGAVDGLTNYVAPGHILGSGTARSFQLQSLGKQTQVFQTDMAFVPGLRGGPLCDENGCVLGLVTVGFASEDLGGLQSRYQWVHAVDFGEMNRILRGAVSAVKPLSELPRYR